MGSRGPVNRGEGNGGSRTKAGRRRRFDRIETESAMFVWNLSHGRGCKTRAKAITERLGSSQMPDGCQAARKAARGL